MPLYRYRCECGREEEALLPMASRNNPHRCECELEMRRVLEVPAPAIIPATGRDKTLKVLNHEEGWDFPGGTQYRPRYEEAFAQGLNPERPIIGRGF